LKQECDIQRFKVFQHFQVVISQKHRKDICSKNFLITAFVDNPIHLCFLSYVLTYTAVAFILHYSVILIIMFEMRRETAVFLKFEDWKFYGVKSESDKLQLLNFVPIPKLSH
jgi:hypothetical protein